MPYTNDSKPSNMQTAGGGKPIGLLLCLTYPGGAPFSIYTNDSKATTSYSNDSKPN